MGAPAIGPLVGGAAHGRAARKMLATPRPFIALIRRQADCHFQVSFPDFPGCVSSGKTIAEARHNAEHALAAQCRRLHHAGRPLPLASFIHELGGDRTDGLVVLILPPAVPGSPR